VRGLIANKSPQQIVALSFCAWLTVASPEEQDGTQLVPRSKMKETDTGSGMSASQSISKRIADLGDWRGKLLAQIRELVKEADPDIVEEWKWMGTPVWSHNGIVCTGETYKQVVKMTFAKGASLRDPKGLFNSSLDGNVRRAIDFHEGDKLDKAALKGLIRASVILNSSSGKKKRSGSVSRNEPYVKAKGKK
jgi:hypothetical protein